MGAAPRGIGAVLYLTGSDAMAETQPLSLSHPMPYLLVVTHDLVVAGELLYEWSDMRPDAPEPYGRLFEIQSAKALAAVRFLRWER